MAATVEVLELVADASEGPYVLVTGLSAEGPVPSARVQILELRATVGAGSNAAVQVLQLTAIAQAAGYVPATLGQSSGSRQWLPYRTRASDGSGTWT